MAYSQSVNSPTEVTTNAPAFPGYLSNLPALPDCGRDKRVSLAPLDAETSFRALPRTPPKQD